MLLTGSDVRFAVRESNDLVFVTGEDGKLLVVTIDNRVTVTCASEGALVQTFEPPPDDFPTGPLRLSRLDLEGSTGSPDPQPEFLLRTRLRTSQPRPGLYRWIVTVSAIGSPEVPCVGWWSRPIPIAGRPTDQPLALARGPRDPAAIGAVAEDTAAQPLRVGHDERVAHPANDDAWAPLAKQFVDDHYGSLRGRVRAHVIDAHLHRHMGPPPRRVVDIGGGAGGQSMPLARAGYEVTIVDPSAAMLEHAAARRADEPDDVAARVRLIEARGEDAPTTLGGETFDAVLCHGVLMYLDDPAPLVDALCELAAPAGLVSIVAKNVEVMALRHAHEGDWAEAIAAFDSDRQVNGLGVDTRGDRIEHLSELLVRRGVEPVDWYGVRLFTDGWTPDRASTDPGDLVLQAELMASRRDPYRRLSRLFHLIGRRPS